MSNINFHKLIVLIRVPPRTHLQKGRWLVEAGWGGGGVFKVKSSDLANVYGKFNIGLEHYFYKTQPPPPPSTPHTHTHTIRFGGKCWIINRIMDWYLIWKCVSILILVTAICMVNIAYICCFRHAQCNIPGTASSVCALLRIESTNISWISFDLTMFDASRNDKRIYNIYYTNIQRYYLGIRDLEIFFNR